MEFHFQKLNIFDNTPVKIYNLMLHVLCLKAQKPQASDGWTRWNTLIYDPTPNYHQLITKDTNLFEFYSLTNVHFRWMEAMEDRWHSTAYTWHEWNHSSSVKEMLQLRLKILSTTTFSHTRKKPFGKINFSFLPIQTD